ncbi:MAG: DUF5615 family PIN-like protein [Chloroflexi bacterium]|nr:DUF5615 family PIN-like protein [Chloroflexota bacterium]
MLRLYFDEHVPLELARQLRLQGIDVLTARDAGKLRVPDEVHLAFATAQQRVLLTFDRDYVGISESWFLSGRSHCGIVIAYRYPSRQIGLLFHMCMNLCSRESPESVANLLFPLEQYR